MAEGRTFPQRKMRFCTWICVLVSTNTLLSASGFSAGVGRRRTTQLHLGGSKDDITRKQQQRPLVTSRQPHKLADGRGTFLGFREAKDVPGLKSSAEPIMPDGGLSPCVIRVLGVGGGGCNAVRFEGCSLTASSRATFSHVF